MSLIAYKDIKQGQVFQYRGSERPIFIKHSDAVSFDENGRDAVFGLLDPCIIIRSIDQDLYNLLWSYIHKHDKIFKRRS